MYKHWYRALCYVNNALVMFLFTLDHYTGKQLLQAEHKKQLLTFVSFIVGLNRDFFNNLRINWALFIYQMIVDIVFCLLLGDWKIWLIIKYALLKHWKPYKSGKNDQNRDQFLLKPNVNIFSMGFENFCFPFWSANYRKSLL